MEAPLLTSPRPGDTLLLYLAVTEEAGSSVLVREEDNLQSLIYYVSNIFKGPAARYSRIEKVGYTLLLSARRLRPYFQAHAIRVMTDLPLEKHLTKLEKSGRMRTWGVELGEFALEYVPRAAMKSQVLVDFVVECTIPPPTEELPPPPMELGPWVAFVDGSACEAGSGAGVVLESPEGLLTEHALRFTFRASNNAAEYEAALAAIWLAKAAGAKRLQIKSDSQLVVGQATGEFEAKDEAMKRYQERNRGRDGLLR